VHNLSPIPTEVKFGTRAELDGELVNLLSDDHSTPDASGKHSMLLEPYGYRWFRIGGLDYLLRRSET
jgi:maltose alpha-D-glucosyltransferase/alpha-amylase